MERFTLLRKLAGFRRLMVLRWLAGFRRLMVLRWLAGFRRFTVLRKLVQGFFKKINALAPLAATKKTREEEVRDGNALQPVGPHPNL